MVYISRLYIGLLLSVPDEKPAGTIPVMWEKTVHAGLLHWWIENDLGLAVFVRYLVIVLDAHAAKGLVICGQTVSKHAIVRTIQDSEQTQSSHERSPGDSLEPWAAFFIGLVTFDLVHRLNYTRPLTGQ
jgi:hypothetical protein